jgi:hypothetical protein
MWCALDLCDPRQPPTFRENETDGESPQSIPGGIAPSSDLDKAELESQPVVAGDTPDGYFRLPDSLQTSPGFPWRSLNRTRFRGRSEIPRPQF